MNNKEVLRIVLLLFYLIAGLSIFAVFHKVNASGVATTLSVTNIAASTATETSLHYVASNQFAAGDVIKINVPSAVTLANCATPTTDADYDTSGSVADGSSGVSGTTYTYTFSGPTTLATTSGVTFCIKVSAIAGNYSVAFNETEVTRTNEDYGAALFYVGSANVVTVTAEVQPSLAFVIRDSADSTDTNTCALGLLTLVSVGQCSYRLKVTTNSTSGYTVQVNTDGDLRRSGSGDVADALDIDPVSAGVSITSGTERYGVNVAAGSATGGSTPTLAGVFATPDSPLPISSPTNLYTVAGINSPAASGDTTNTALVTHKAAIAGKTYTGNYTQLVTYTVAANF